MSIFDLRLRHCVAIMTSFEVRVMTMFGYSLNPPPPRMPRTSTTHVTRRIRIFDKISEHVKVAKSVDIAVPELAVT